MILVMIAIIAVSSIIMGSGNAPFFAFAALTPTVAAKMSVAPVVMLLPMHLAGARPRHVSNRRSHRQASSMGGVSPFDVVKRTAIPMAGALITLVTANFVFFYSRYGFAVTQSFGVDLSGFLTESYCLHSFSGVASVFSELLERHDGSLAHSDNLIFSCSGRLL